MTPLRSPRWALSFADLCLLLLGFFVLLQAQRNDPRVAESLRAAFGTAHAADVAAYPADQLFEKGEAVLLPTRKAWLLTMAGSAAASGDTILVQSRGTGAGSSRLDAWELSAARVGAVARTLREGGLAERDIRIVMPPIGDKARGGQHIGLTEVRSGR